MRVTLLKNQLCKGFGEPARARKAGDVVDFPSHYALWLMDTGRAELCLIHTEAPLLEIDATPAAQRLAKAREIDLAEVEGRGEDGRILVSDVRDHLEA